MLAGEKLPSLVALIQHRLPDLRAVYLFGSAARGQSRRDSDIDLAVLSPRPLATGDRFDLARDCSAELSGEVDLVDFGAVPLTLQAAIIGEGRRLFAASAREMDFLENAILSRYCAFNEERRPLFAAIAARGSIHA